MRQLNKTDKFPLFSEDMLVYLLAPSASALQTNSKKIRLDYVGPLVIKEMLDRSHALLETLEGQRLTGIFHVNRLKIAWLRTDTGSISSVRYLRAKTTNIVTNEKGKNLAPLQAYCKVKTAAADNQHMLQNCVRNAKQNNNLAAAILLKSDHIDRLIAHTQLSDGTFEVSRARFKNGCLQVLVQLDNSGKHAWIDLSTHPQCTDGMQNKILDNKHIRVCGSKKYFALGKAVCILVVYSP